MNLFEKLNRLDDSLVESKRVVRKKLTEGIWAYQTYVEKQPGEKQPSKSLTYGNHFIMSRSPYRKERFGANWKNHINKIIEWCQENNPGLIRETHDFRFDNFGKNLNTPEAFIAAIEQGISTGKYELILTEALSTNEYELVYHQNTASRDRRPETANDVYEDWTTSVFRADSDLDAWKEAFERVTGNDYTDYLSQDARESDFVEYFEESDWGDGSPILIKLSSSDSDLYDTGYTLESWIDEFVEQDDIDEMLTESTEQYELSTLVKDSINHLVNDLGRDSMADDFGDDVCADLEDNYDIDVPQNPVKYADWCDAVKSEVSKQVISEYDDLGIDTRTGKPFGIHYDIDAPEYDNIDEMLTESTNKVKLEVKFETYGRYGDGGDIRKGRVSGSTEVEALMKMLDHVHMYTDSDYAEEFKERTGRYPTTEEVLDNLYDQNGDGCDLIYYIRNLTTGEMIFDGGVEESDPEEWD